MSWVGVDGAGWSWVHGLVIPIDIYIYNANDIRRIFNLLSIYIGLKLSLKNSNFFISAIT